MSRKRVVLELLGRGELQESADRYDLEVEDRRVKDSLVDALARSKKANLDQTWNLSREPRSIELCLR